MDTKYIARHDNVVGRTIAKIAGFEDEIGLAIIYGMLFVFIAAVIAAVQVGSTTNAGFGLATFVAILAGVGGAATAACRSVVPTRDFEACFAELASLKELAAGVNSGHVSPQVKALARELRTLVLTQDAVYRADQKLRSQYRDAFAYSGRFGTRCDAEAFDFSAHKWMNVALHNALLGQIQEIRAAHDRVLAQRASWRERVRCVRDTAMELALVSDDQLMLVEEAISPQLREMRRQINALPSRSSLSVEEDQSYSVLQAARAAVAEHGI